VEAKVDGLSSQLGHLEDFEKIDRSLKRTGRRPGDAAAVVAKAEELQKKGVTVESLDRLAAEFEKRGMKGADAPAEVAELVKKHGTLKVAVASQTRELDAAQKETGRLNRRLPLLQQREKQREAACKQVGRRLGGLQKRSGSLEDNFTQREKTLEESHRQREAALTGRLTSMESDTKQRCAGMVTEANRTVSKIESDGAERFERKQEGWSRSIRTMQGGYNQLSEDNQRLDSETNEKHDRIVTCEALWAFVMKKQPLYFDQVRRFYQRGGVSAGMPLPEPLRATLVEAMKTLAESDALVRLDLAEKKRVETERSTRDTLRKEYVIYHASENAMSQFERVFKGLTSYEDVRRGVILELLQEPSFVWGVLDKADDSFLEEVFLEASYPGRSRIRGVLDSAAAESKRDSDRRFSAYCDAMFARQLSQIRAQVNAIPMVSNPSPPLVYRVTPKRSSSAVVEAVRKPSAIEFKELVALASLGEADDDAGQGQQQRQSGQQQQQQSKAPSSAADAAARAPRGQVKACVYCASMIPAIAKFCPDCGVIQKPPRAPSQMAAQPSQAKPSS
jgi:hypothetical protein